MSDPASILPSNATRAEHALEQAIHVAKPDVSDVKTLMNPRTCPAHLLTWLAWSFSVDVWDESWPEETKRNVIATSPSIHRRKGTLGAIQDAIRVAGYNRALIIERYGWEVADGAYHADGGITAEPADHWAEYRVQLTRLVSISQANQIRAILNAIAPARSVLKSIDFRQATGLADGTLIADGTFSAGIA